MANKPLRLRNDLPYPGESLSSFLERTAQFYGTPFKALLDQLMEGHDRRAIVGRDLDLNPPDVLQSRLADSMQDWHSPLAEHRGFHGWAMTPARRYAYCPICFSEDLAEGRTPYFRMDWIATYVTICWVHGTPLLEWKYRNCEGRRRLPQAWLYRKRFDKVTWPEFVTEHCRLLERLNGREHDEKGLTSAGIFDYLYGLQVAIEKRSAERMYIYPQAQDPRDEMRSVVGGLVTAAAQAQDRSVLYVICSGPHALSVDYAWLGLRESDIPRYPKCSMGDAIRQTEVLEWRRTCLLFAARTLAGSNRYGQAIAPDPSAERPWRELWFDGLRQGAKDHWGDGFEQLMAMWGNQLDEPAPPVHGFGIGSNHRRTRPTHKWIQSWLSRYVLDTWQ